MPYQFENRNRLTEAQMIEHAEVVFRQNWKALLSRLILALILLLCGGYILNFDPFLCTITLIVFAVSATIAFPTPQKEGSRAYQALLEYYDSSAPATRVLFGDKIVIESPDQTRVLEYQKIQRVVATKSAYIIYDKKPSFIVLDPNGFTEGTFEEFKGFLKNKCPHLDIPQ